MIVRAFCQVHTLLKCQSKYLMGYSHDRQIHVHRKVDTRKVTVWIHTAALDDRHVCIFECFTDQ